MKKSILLHIWMIVGNFIFPFMNVLLPYIYWKQNRQTEDTAFTQEACNLLNFQILFSSIMIGVFVWGWYRTIVHWSVGEIVHWNFIGWTFVLWVAVNVVYPLFIVFITAAKGKSFRAWPPTIPFFRA